MKVEAVGSWILLAMTSMVCVNAQNAPPLSVSARKPGTIRIDLIGDSTQTDNAGYGRGFCANLKQNIDCLNFARGGQSTKSFRADGIWEKALNSQPDYMLIQFGHNDETSGKPVGNQSTVEVYRENLRSFVMEARERKITPILVTPLTRRNWGKDGKIHSDLTAYAQGMETVAKEMQVPLIDLQSRSIAYLDSIGKEQGTKLGITKKDKDGKVQLDGTHLNWEGSYIFGRMVAEDLGRAVPALSPSIQPAPATLPAEGILAMKVIQGAPFAIVLVGDSSVAPNGGWGPGFCETLTKNVICVDRAQASTTSTAYIESGQWQRALAEKGQYYFIEFGDTDPTKRDAKVDPKITKRNLQHMVHEVRAAGAIPILVSPLVDVMDHDGKGKEEDHLQPYADVARDVATEDRVTFVDLYQMSRHYLRQAAPQQADGLTMAPAAGATGESRPLLSKSGASLFGRLIADNVIRTEVELGPNVVGLPEGAGPMLPRQAAPTDGR